jgi:hypothetical protein
MLLLEDLMHEQFKSLLRANTGVAAAVHYTRSRPPLNVLPLFDSLEDAEVAQLMRDCDSQAQKQVCGSTLDQVYICQCLNCWDADFPSAAAAPL